MNPQKKYPSYTIYGIRSQATGKVYVGYTNNLSSRKSQHIQKLRRGGYLVTDPKTKKRYKSQMQLDFDKYGESDLEVYVLERDVPFEQRLSAERKWIEAYKSYDPEYGYNIRPMSPMKLREGIPPIPSGLRNELSVKEGADHAP